jgi:hypothetical protein
MKRTINDSMDGNSELPPSKKQKVDDQTQIPVANNCDSGSDIETDDAESKSSNGNLLTDYFLFKCISDLFTSNTDIKHKTHLSYSQTKHFIILIAKNALNVILRQNTLSYLSHKKHSSYSQTKHLIILITQKAL